VFTEKYGLKKSVHVMVTLLERGARERAQPDLFAFL
jgi:hypothetical protein